ncbi:MAG: hypothetical protein GY795_48865, partial [Desulfobacterales bacterium]|nr:hypothetical protein [Desulfobacterales bacterium]
IIDARGTETAFYRRDRHGNYKHIRPAKGGIIRSGILPGFQFRISDLYTRPSLEELAGDKVYHDYVFPSHKEVKQRAEKAEHRAEQAEHRAEQESELRKQKAAQLEKEKQRTEKEKQRAEKEAELRKQETARAEKERQRAEQLAAKLRELGISPE